MTDHPTPGCPLDAESVKLLKAGDVLRHDEGEFRFVRVRDQGHVVVDAPALTPYDQPSAFTFVSRPGSSIPEEKGGETDRDRLIEFLSDWFEGVPSFTDTGNATIRVMGDTFGPVEFSHFNLAEDLLAALPVSLKDGGQGSLQPQDEAFVPTAQTFWTPSELQAPPQDQSLFWAWLHETGVRVMRWATPDELWDGPIDDDDRGAYVIASDASDGDEYEPEFWAPYEAIPNPAVEWAHCRETEDPS